MLVEGLAGRLVPVVGGIEGVSLVSLSFEDEVANRTERLGRSWEASSLSPRGAGACVATLGG